jgi:hypothetical protein
MRSKISVFLIMGFVASLFALTSLAQTEEQKGQLYIGSHYVVKPSMAGKFEAGVKEWVAQCAEHNHPYLWYARSSVDYGYLFFTPIKNFTDIDTMDKADVELEKKIGEEQLKAMAKQFEGSYEHFELFILRTLPELSSIPEKPRLQPEEIKFVCVDFYYIKPGKEKEFEGVMKEWKALAKSKNIPGSYNLSVRVIGTDIPVYAGGSSGKNAADYYNQLEKTWELFGDEGEALWKKTIVLCRKYEEKTSWRRPDLSYIPKEK